MRRISDVNKAQAEFYNVKKKNLPTLIWSKLRNGLLTQVRQNSGMQQQSYNQHKIWFGNLANKKVLDLGCFAGNYWSLYLAEHSKEYWGIDLSDVGIARLEPRIKSFPNARAITTDFLSADFTERNFDLIYAYGVLHHFEDTSILIERLNEKLATAGQIISYDPLQTNLLVNLVRKIYRPFQSDAAWEWPFSKKTFFKFQNAFTIIEKRGILGKSKWLILISFLPISSQRKNELSKKWHKEDWDNSNVSESKLFDCMHLTMLMQKK